MRIAVVSLAGMLMLGSGLALAADSMVTASLRGSIDVEVVFTDEEIRIIRAHYQSGGHERIIVAGKILPVEIATQVVRDVLIETILD
jgi:5-keto 4-deoxyuronate isomerase